MAHYDAANTAVAPNSGPDSKPEEEWSIKFEGEPTTPVASNGVAYVGVRDDSYYAVDISEGETIWNYQTGEFETPAISDTQVFVSGEGIEALKPGNGDQIWASGHEPLSNLRIKQGVVYGSSDRHVYGVNTGSGEEVQSIEVSSSIVSFSIDRNRIYIKTQQNKKNYQIECYSMESGNFMWDYEIQQSNWGHGGLKFPVTNGRVITRDQKALTTIDGETGEGRIINEFELNLTVSVSVADSVVYCPLLINELPAVDMESGERISDWEWDPLAGRINWRTPIADSTLYVWASRGVSSGFVLIAVDSKTGNQKWEYESQLTGNPAGPTILKDMVLFPDDYGDRLVAIK
ncbi:outer membrane protein assembly factor BamB family protein [Halostagnicola kamekurae]|nr:PQQ-binding-like beta-propeller repeat protein [Halostagnicola kamekurae]